VLDNAVCHWIVLYTVHVTAFSSCEGRFSGHGVLWLYSRDCGYPAGTLYNDRNVETVKTVDFLRQAARGRWDQIPGMKQTTQRRPRLQQNDRIRTQKTKWFNTHSNIGTEVH